jgi:hypothetical protein
LQEGFGDEKGLEALQLRGIPQWKSLEKVDQVELRFAHVFHIFEMQIFRY